MSISISKQDSIETLKDLHVNAQRYINENPGAANIAQLKDTSAKVSTFLGAVDLSRMLPSNKYEIDIDTQQKNALQYATMLLLSVGQMRSDSDVEDTQCEYKCVIL